MADATYTPKVYRKDSGNTFVVASGGTIAVEDATGAIDFSAATPSSATTGALVTTGTTWIDNTAAGGTAFKLLCSYSATSGDSSTMRIRGRADAACNVITGSFSASSGAAQYGTLTAIEGVAQPGNYAQTNAANILCGVYARSDLLAIGSSGRDWPLWVDTHMAAKAAAGSYLARFSHNGTVANDGMMTIYNGGRMPVMFNFEDAAGFLTDADASKTTPAGAIAVKTPAGTKYIVLYT